MGILIENTITLDNGLTCANTYGSLGTSHIIIEKVEEIIGSDGIGEPIKQYTGNYSVTCIGSIWSTKEMRDSSSIRLMNIPIHLEITESQLTGNMYSILYSNWKSKYTNVKDV